MMDKPIGVGARRLGQNGIISRLPLCLRVFVVKMALGVLSVLAVQSPLNAQQINLPPVTHLTWPNGIRVVIMEYHKAPSITVNCIFPGGSSQDPADKAGVAGFTASLLRKGTEKRTANQ